MTPHPPGRATWAAGACGPGGLPATTPDAPLDTLVVGAGFGGICMGIALLRAANRRFLILEKGSEVGGVWRDNSYPGAACDVPSHLYSFSFAPNPDWSHRFATQPEIHAYLRDCAQHFGLMPYIHFGHAIAEARFDEARALWALRTEAGARLYARTVVTATGLLSRPAMPRIEGIGTFRGRSFHSAKWDHAFPLQGKRVAVIGTGASATQFVPAIAGQVGDLLVFQRSPAYLIARGDQAYRAWHKRLFRHLPPAMRLHRALIYAKYESRALAFTRLKGIMRFAVDQPFRRMLARDVPDPALRARLVPDYPIGCKRILLSDDYLATFSRPNVRLVSDAVRRIVPEGVETADGTLHRVDAIIYGTGFAATDFLAPMRVTGRGALDLNTAWRDGAEAYLGISVPGFPNFFMLYGPNTNLGHNSIVYMLESQVAHIMRCLRAMERAGATTVEVGAAAHREFNGKLHARLDGAVWTGCSSWYLDRHGRNSANWPGFSFSYRWLARHASLAAYRFAAPLPGHPGGLRIKAPSAIGERLHAAFQRAFLRTCFKPLIGPPLGVGTQRALVGLLAPLMPGVDGVRRHRRRYRGVPVEIHAPLEDMRRPPRGGVILYLHGGAFCLGSPATHRSITTRLARESGMTVWAPEYRLAPEHPYPAALDDAETCYEALLDSGIGAGDIVFAGDSAGASLALALALRLRDEGRPLPAGLALASPVADPLLDDGTVASRARIDPMVRKAWVAQGLAWYGCAPDRGVHAPLACSLHGLPPMLVQVGDQEILHGDALRLAAHAAHCGVSCLLEEYEGRWHVFHLQAFYLRSAREAIARLAGFAGDCVAPAPPRARQAAPGSAPALDEAAPR